MRNEPTPFESSGSWPSGRALPFDLQAEPQEPPEEPAVPPSGETRPFVAPPWLRVFPGL